MGSKGAKGSKKTNVANKDALSRINFLHQASALLLSTSSALSRRYVSDLRSIGRKSQLQLDPSIKRRLCKRCHTMLVDGKTCERHVENLSKKQEARCDVLVVKCKLCDAKKRFPRNDERLLWTANEKNIA